MNIFDGFFWIEPRRESRSEVFSSCSPLWFYPEDLSKLPVDLREIPQFCFPDLETIRIERPELNKNEHFTFTLTNSSGGRVYGVCLRAFHQGEGKHYDVKRRAKICLCLITKLPYYTMFRTILLQVHSLSLLENGIEHAKAFLASIYARMAPSNGDPVEIQRSSSLLMQHDIILNTPKGGGQSHLEVPILPLLEILGVDRLLLVQSAIMCEKRLIFVADEIGLLTSMVLAAGAMLYPFRWQHIFIPLLPSKLLSYAAAPVPFIIGVRRYLLPRVKNEAIEDVIIVDLDSGDCTLHGGAKIKDFIGESGSSMKQASESFEKVKLHASLVANSMASILLGSSGKTSAGESSNAGGEPRNRDLVFQMMTDLRNVLANKPGGTSLQAVAGTLLRGTSDSSKNKWASESERIIRETLLLFYAYLFYDLDDLIVKKALGKEISDGEDDLVKSIASRTLSAFHDPKGLPSRAGNEFNKGDSRAAFNLSAFKQRKALMGDAKAVQEFLDDFFQSQMFEQFCAERVKKCQRKVNAWSASDSLSEDDTDEYDRICKEIKARQVSPTVVNVRSAVQSMRRYNSSSSSFGSSGVSEDSGAVNILDFHDLSIQLTHPNSKDSDINAYAERVCADACHSDQFTKVMRTIQYRLSDAHTKQAGKALSLLHILLLSGPEWVLSESLDFITPIRFLLEPGNVKLQAIEYLSISGMSSSTAANFDLKPKALAVLFLLLDQHKLSNQRKWSDLWRNGSFPHLRYAPLKTDLLLGSAFTSRQMQPLSSLHRDFRPLYLTSNSSSSVIRSQSSSSSLDLSDDAARSRSSTGRNSKGWSGSFPSVQTTTNLIDFDFEEAKPLSTALNTVTDPFANSDPFADGTAHGAPATDLFAQPDLLQANNSNPSTDPFAVEDPFFSV